MIRLLCLILVCSVTLCACKPGDSADLNDTLNLLEGKPLTTTQLAQVSSYLATSSAPDYTAGSSQIAAIIVAAAAVEQQSVPVSSSSVEPVVYVPPPPEVCEENTWRGWVYDCHGNQLRPTE